MLDTVSMRGVVVIGEGEKDEAPMLQRRRGRDGTGPRSMLPSIHRSTRLTALGMPNAIAVIAVRAGNDVLPGAALYMNKIAVILTPQMRSTSTRRLPRTSSESPKPRATR
jgi:fructose-1,6-bisphosphatase II